MAASIASGPLRIPRSSVQLHEHHEEPPFSTGADDFAPLFGAESFLCGFFGVRFFLELDALALGDSFPSYLKRLHGNQSQQEADLMKREWGTVDRINKVSGFNGFNRKTPKSRLNRRVVCRG